MDEDYPDKERIVLVMDNLNTHHPERRCTRPSSRRRHWRIAQRLEIHYTPKHGSWLNIAEIELGVLARQCLDRRIPQPGRLGVGNRSMARGNETGRQFERTGASPPRTPAIKLKSLYPSIQ